VRHNVPWIGSVADGPNQDDAVLGFYVILQTENYYCWTRSCQM